MKYEGMKAVIMGLGLHGGGLESARYLGRRGAELTITDLRDEKVLSASMEILENSGIKARYVLGRHDEEDFKNADMVIKNPAVKPDSPYLGIARRVETDISLFLAESRARLIAVTGSKGKSGAASALRWVLDEARKGGILEGSVYLGGNITVSPLSFLETLTEKDDVVLELSSWQLGDLAGRTLSRGGGEGRPLLKPRAAALTAIMPDHQDRYGSMEAYVADKRIIYAGQDSNDVTVAGNDNWGRSFLAETKGRPLVYSNTPLPPGVGGGWIENPAGPGFARLRPSSPPVQAVPDALLVPGVHQKQNLLAAALALLDLGLESAFVRESLGRYPGIEHRLEFFHEAGGVRFYNDSAATIPEAAAAAINAFDTRLILLTGGADKNLDFSPLVRAVSRADAENRLGALILLAGTGSAKLRPLLEGAGIPCCGPFDDLDKAVLAAGELAKNGDAVVLSPGCTSFGMFLNEFDRGRKWKDAVKRLM
ncbi:MAG: UDP-N-acetylmuramoyl-L-alanine--D-glutamate ligase [Treponema sp.]|jgi:UDP-N-acetylmuramoylalanine--D-glutamate ligase|nr:UDP-N-acetylmuramoyl-L-alanine--D-glutamate ligase [Treponema sp.]